MPYKDRNKYLKTQKQYYKRDKETYKWRVRCNKHGITKDKFFELLTKQDGKCVLCDQPFKSLWGNDLHIDHCHETERVRGLLCMGCNVGLGMLGDNEEGLMKALNYVRGKL